MPIGVRQMSQDVVDEVQAVTQSAEGTAVVDAAIRSRYAARAFDGTPVSLKIIREILEVARFAPSGANTQPWRVYTLAGAVKATISAALLEAFTHEGGDHQAEYDYYPPVLPEPYGTRRRDFGRVYYGQLRIAPGDLAARSNQTAKNFGFFGAPVGFVFTIDRRLSAGSWLDVGMFLQNVMIAARGRGLDTCPQETFAKFHGVLRMHLPITRNEIVVCGMSVGHCGGTREPQRGLMPKLDVEAFASFHGFSD